MKNVEQEISGLLRLMRQNVQEGNWPQVRHTDKALQSRIGVLKGRDEFKPLLIAVKAQYGAIIEELTRNKNETEQKMKRLTQDKEGIAAYLQVSGVVR